LCAPENGEQGGHKKRRRENGTTADTRAMRTLCYKATRDEMTASSDAPVGRAIIEPVIAYSPSP
jgi:hypothetical protein